MNLPFKIKICGITRVEDAKAAVDAGADAIGLNFYPGSKRYLRPDSVTSVVTAIPERVAKIGVFVNPTLAELHEVFVKFTEAEAKLDWLQIHGVDHPDAFVDFKKLGLPILQAFRWGRDDANQIDDYLSRCASLQCSPRAMLIDAYKVNEHGGTGQTVDWPAVAQWRESASMAAPLVLAGGLTPTNVAEAIQIVHPDAVDTASGVETSPGQKDARLMREFIDKARRAFAGAK
jgi:phosphoribosylanthranilate isomerase